MKISRQSSFRSENMAVMHHWNVAGALHSPNGIRLKAKVPYGQIVGLIPLMSAMVQPNASLCCRSVSINFSSCASCSLDEMITCSVLSFPSDSKYLPVEAVPNYLFLDQSGPYY
ncbi:hypothetical protein V6N13_041290 [Hibiscus sabdariffa]